MEEEIKKDEEQIVEDIDADTRDVIDAEKKEDAKIDEIMARLDNFEASIGEMFENLAAVIVKSGAGVVMVDDTEDEVEEAYENLVDMDFTLDDIED